MNQPSRISHPFIALEYSLTAIQKLKRPIEELARKDPDLTRQIRRAASSVAQNLGEGCRRAGKDRTYHYRVAAGSAEETRVSLLVAVAWGYLASDDLAEPLRLFDRILAILHSLTR